MAPHQTHVEDGEPSLYDVLSITPKHLEGQAAPAQARVVKKAYHRALLQNHPDKAGHLSRNNSSAATAAASPSSPRSSLPASSTAPPKSTSAVLYTVDQIQRAYNVLSDVRQRAEYNRDLTLRRQQNLQSPSSNNSNGGNGSYFSFSHSSRGQGSSSSSGHGRSASFTFRASGGIRTVDLDDLDWDENTGIYSASCRCGNPRAYRFTEDDLEAFESDGVLMVECLDCSLWLRVLFAPVDGDEDGGEGNEANGAAATTSREAKEKDTQQRESEGGEQRMSRKNGEGLQRSVSRQGSSSGGKWSFNWSVNFGISVGGSASATASSGGGGSDDRDKGVSRR